VSCPRTQQAKALNTNFWSDSAKESNPGLPTMRRML